MVISYAAMRNARIIQSELAIARLPSAMAKARGAWIIASLTNSYEESNGWQADIQSGFVKNGVREDSWGLFQANRTAGVGRGHTVADLQDPRINTRLIIQEMRDQDERTGLLSKVSTIGTVGACIEVFTREVERPADALAVGRRRLELGIEMWGRDLIYTPAWRFR